MAQLFDSTLGGTATTIDTGAAGVAQTANVLLVVIYARTDQAATIKSDCIVRFNNDAAANYDQNQVDETNGAVTGGTNAGGNFAPKVPGASVSANIFAALTLWIPAYTQTTGHKAVIVHTGWSDSTVANDVVQVFGARWRSIAAITRLSITAGGGSNFVAGTRMTIYGLT